MRNKHSTQCTSTNRFISYTVDGTTISICLNDVTRKCGSIINICKNEWKPKANTPCTLRLTPYTVYYSLRHNQHLLKGGDLTSKVTAEGHNTVQLLFHVSTLVLCEKSCFVIFFVNDVHDWNKAEHFTRQSK